MHRIPKGQHSTHRGERFVSVSLDVLPECEGAIKKEPQVAPCGARPERGDWSAAGLSMSDDAELRAIADGVRQAYDVGLEDVQQVHVFSDSANALRLTMDVSHHLGQHLSLSICKVLVPWLRHHPNHSVHFHHITPGVELEDHQLAHILATSTRIEAGGASVISADFARRRAVTWMLEGWNSLFQSKKYIGSNFLTLYQRKDTPFVPTHVKSGPWMCKAGHSHSLTAHLVPYWGLPL
jgi:hypothetical protein